MPPTCASDPEAFSDELRAAFELGSFYSGVDYVQAQRLRRQLMAETERAMAGFAATGHADLAGAGDADRGQPARARHAPAAQHHAVQRARPAGDLDALRLHGRGLPIGLQIVGRAFDEGGVLRVAEAYEQATDWHQRRPPL